MKERRSLLIGFSSPIAYSYEVVKKNMPCPILESPIAYCLLYDDIWFISRKLCPPELEKLSFVHFVNEEYFEKLPFKDIPEEEKERLQGWDWKEWQRIVDLTVGNAREWRCDNHSRSFNFGGIQVLPTPGSRANLFIDRYVATRYGFELAENTPNSEASLEVDTKVLQISVAEQLVRNQFSTLKAPSGYWHDCLYELREDRFLKDFRRKIGSLEIGDSDLVTAKVDELLCEYRRQIRKTFEKRFNFDFPGFVYSTAKFLIGTIPGTGPLVSGCEWIGEIGKKICDSKNNAWTAFLASVDSAGSSTHLTIRR